MTMAINVMSNVINSKEFDDFSMNEYKYGSPHKIIDVFDSHND